MQDLVRIGVADAAEQPRIGERALQRVIRRGQARRELFVSPKTRRSLRGRGVRSPPRPRPCARSSLLRSPLPSASALPVESNAASAARPFTSSSSPNAAFRRSSGAAPATVIFKTDGDAFPDPAQFAHFLHPPPQSRRIDGASRNGLAISAVLRRRTKNAPAPGFHNRQRFRNSGIDGVQVCRWPRRARHRSSQSCRTVCRHARVKPGAAPRARVCAVVHHYASVNDRIPAPRNWSARSPAYRPRNFTGKFIPTSKSFLLY